MSLWDRVSSLFTEIPQATLQPSSSKFKHRYSLSIGRAAKEPSTSTKEEDKPTREQDRLRIEERALAAADTSKRKLISGAAELSKGVFTEIAQEIPAFFSQKAKELIQAKSFKKVGSELRFVDIVKDVIHALPVHWISHVVCQSIYVLVHANFCISARSTSEIQGIREGRMV